MPPPAEPDAPASAAGLTALLAACLERYADEGVPGLCAVLEGHPAEARQLLERVLLLARLGLLPDPPASRD